MRCPLNCTFPPLLVPDLGQIWVPDLGQITVALACHHSATAAPPVASQIARRCRADGAFQLHIFGRYVACGPS